MNALFAEFNGRNALQIIKEDLKSYKAVFNYLQARVDNETKGIDNEIVRLGAVL